MQQRHGGVGSRRVRVRLTRKLADVLDGIDLANSHVGDVLLLARADARLLMAEGWAVPAARAPARRRYSTSLSAIAADFAQHRLDPRPYRRIEDRLRDELQDATTRTISGKQS